MNLFFRAAVILLCLPAVGCLKTHTFLVVDAVTNQPLSGVAVTRSEWTQRTISDGPFISRRVPDLNRLPLGNSGADGVLVSQTRWMPFRADVGVYLDTLGFDFDKPGYKQADATIQDGTARINSPSPPPGSSKEEYDAADARSVTVDSHAVIRVPMHAIVTP